MLASSALVQIPTGYSVRIQDVTLGTGTSETALCVLTGKLARWWSQFALVHIFNTDNKVSPTDP